MWPSAPAQFQQLDNNSQPQNMGGEFNMESLSLDDNSNKPTWNQQSMGTGSSNSTTSLGQRVAELRRIGA